MTPQDPKPELDLLHREPEAPASQALKDSPLDAEELGEDEAVEDEGPIEPSRLPRNLSIAFVVMAILLVIAFFGARTWARHAMRDSLPQLDGSVAIPGLSARVTVQRDTHGVPYIHAANLDDLITAQGFITAQDRLWQMEALRRHAAGTLAEIIGSSLIPADRTQRILQLRAAADRAAAVLPPDQLHYLDLYARGVNASIAAQRDHLPLEFRLLHFTPAPWTPRDSLLVSIAMYQDLSNAFPQKLTRELLSTRLPSSLIADLYPVGSWRDHPPAQPLVDLTAPQQEIPDIPLDESQTLLHLPAEQPAALIALQKSLASQTECQACTAGSNNWAIAGSRTASGKPLLSNDPHLSLSVPNIWYETSLEANTPSGAPFHVAGVALPGTPFIILGHNDHVAWGFTNLAADVQDIFIERTRTTPQGTQFLSSDGSWQPVVHHQETIHVRFGKDVVLDVVTTKHGQLETPIISSLFNGGVPQGRNKAPQDIRPLALAWTIYDPANVTSPFLGVNSATDWASFNTAFSTWGGPAQNVVYADDQGHIGYHAVGKIPLRGSTTSPSPLSPVPVVGWDPARQWAGYIPFEQLPQILDPTGGILATANSRITPDLYPFPITLNWSDPYRNERIWKVLSSGKNLTPADTLKLQTDVYSDVDHAIAQRLAYAIDHAGPHTTSNPQRLHQAADILRSWNGSVDIESSAPNIVLAARAALWPMLLTPKTGIPAVEVNQVYTWGEKTFAQEQIILHTPDRWLPAKGAKWDDVLAASVENGLLEARAPQDLSKWAYGKTHPLEIEHPLLSLSPLIGSVLGVPIGTGVQSQSGDSTTVKQVGRTFGPSQRLTVDLSDLDHSTLNLVLGQSGNPLSPYFMDQFSAWYHGTTFALPFSSAAVQGATTHTLTLTPQ